MISEAEEAEDSLALHCVSSRVLAPPNGDTRERDANRWMEDAGIQFTK